MDAMYFAALAEESIKIKGEGERERERDKTRDYHN